MSILNSKPENSVDYFTYFGSNISSTVNNVNILVGKEWPAIDKLLTLSKYNL